jgi:hypothetical protein
MSGLDMNQERGTLNFDLICVAFLTYVLAILAWTVVSQHSYVFDDGDSRIVIGQSFVSVGQLALYGTFLVVLLFALRALERTRRVLGAVSLISMLLLFWAIFADRIDSGIHYENPIVKWMEKSWSIRILMDHTFVPAMVLQIGLIGPSIRAIESAKRLTWNFSLRDMALLGVMFSVFAALLRFHWLDP